MKPPVTTPFADALARTLKQIRAAEIRFNREPESVSLLAVSKTKPVDAIREAMAAGQRAFGENYVDEALDKIKVLADSVPTRTGPPCEWHFIGAIQSNKTRVLAENLDWVHALDREKIARRLSEQRPADRPPLNCCVQLNLDHEATKSGVTEKELPELCETVAQLPGLNLRGLMVIPAPRDTLTEQRAIFSRVHALYETQKQRWPTIDTLSMGMSNDIEAAIAEGSTMVRVGTALFGARDRPA
ncbi:MAG: YggS family pyridoxal phosphate-dependent enzyme [Granulosicoccus sp.]|nr:YggS family pyridoxal phosphate-dependent enzyme [Granulosicoccus sp.]